MLTAIADERFAQVDQPEKFLNVAYRLKTSALKELNSEQKQAFWQHFIWQTWHERVNQNLANYTLLVYQGFFIFLNDCQLSQQIKKLFSIKNFI
ncbi:hypothetical protein SDC49_26405 [Lactobacillus sp. R2/2]|nr:hypothetical protein [Lactobacillus sp. R2/2]